MKLTKSQVTDEMKEALFAWWDAEIEADTYFLAEGCANRELENISYELYVKLVALLNGHSYYVAKLVNWTGLKHNKDGFAIPRKGTSCTHKVIVNHSRIGKPIEVLCGTWYGGEKMFCPTCQAEYSELYPQGWKYYPGDVCKHGVYTGGCGADYMCGQCETGED